MDYYAYLFFAIGILTLLLSVFFLARLGKQVKKKKRVALMGLFLCGIGWLVLGVMMNQSIQKQRENPFAQPSIGESELKSC